MGSLISQNLSSIILFFWLIMVLILITAFILFFCKRKTEKNTDRFEELFSKILTEIKSSVAPKFMSVSVEANEITELAIEIWRIEQRIEKSAPNLPENQLKGLENSVQKMRRYLEKYDIEIIDYKNHRFNDGLNLDILSVEKDPSLSEPVIKETIEPTVMFKGQIIRKAKIILSSNS